MAYRRSYGRRYRRRAVSRVRTVTGKSASFVKLPSYKNMAYRGNERSGVLHEIKFVKQVPLNFEVTSVSDYNYAFLYIDCMAELINSQDFLKYASQFQDYCPYAVTVSAACPVSLVGNSLLTNRLYDWPYFSTTPGRELSNFNNMSINNAQLGKYLINAGQFYPVGSLPQSADYPITLETFDSFFASHSTSKKLWNANIPYGVRYARYYATSAQKAQVNNILQDAIVHYEYNDLPDIIAANVQSDVGSVNLLFRNSNGNVISMGNPVRKSVQIWGRETNMQNAAVYPVRQNDIDSDTQARNFAIYSYLWSLQRSKQGQFNPFYYVGVNLNQTHLSTDNLGKQVLTLTFKFYVYFKNEITDFFQGVTGSAAGGSATSNATTKIIATIDEAGVQDGDLTQQALLQRSISNFRTNRQFLTYVNNSLANQLVQLTIPEIYRQGLQHTFIGNYLLAYYRDDPAVYGAQRNGFVIDESCYDASLNKYVFQGYIDLNPTATSTYLQLNKYEPEAENTDSKFITHFGQDNYSSTMSSDMQNLNVEHTCPQWTSLTEFDNMTSVINVPICSTYDIAPVCYSSTNFSEYTGQQYFKLFESLSNALAKSLDIYTILTNVQSMDPYLFSAIADAPIRILNLATVYDYTHSAYLCQYSTIYGSTFKFSDTLQTGDLVPNFDYSTQNTYVQGLNAYLYERLTSPEEGVPSATLELVNAMLADVPNNTPILTVQDALKTLLICVNCPMSNENLIQDYDYQSTWATDSTSRHRADGYLYPMISLIIPRGIYTGAQVVLFEQLIKDFIVQSQSMLVNSMVVGYDPTAIDLTTTEFYTNFIQYSGLSVYQQYGWYLQDLNYQQALTQAQTTFFQSLPSSASKVWKKIKGFLSKAWSAVKKVGKGLVKVVGGTAAAAYLPGGSAVASALIPSGIKDVTSEISTLVLSGKKKTKHYVDGRLAGITKSSSTGLVKCLVTPGVCPLTTAQPVNLDSNQFIDQQTYEVTSIDIGDYSESRLQTIRFKHNLTNLPKYTYITGDGEEVDGSFVQARLKVQVYMDKPSEDFVLPPTFIGVGVNNYYTEESTA